MKSVVNYSFLIGACLLLNGCLLDNMEKITEATRDEVHATNTAIHETENLQKIARMHGSMIDPALSPSVRNTAAKVVLAKYPENFLAQDLGMLLPTFRMGSFKRSISGVEVELLNVPYVGNSPSKILGVASINEDLMNVVAFAGVQLATELEAKTKSAGISAAEMDDYRTIAGRLVVIVPALLASVKVNSLETTIGTLLQQYTAGTLQAAAFTEELQSSTRGAERAVPAMFVEPTLKTLEQLAVNVSLDEATLAEMRALISVRLGIN